MKKPSAIALFAVLFVFPPIVASAPWEFTVKPNQVFQGAQVGYAAGQLTPYFGVDLFGIGVKYEEHDVDVWSYYGTTYREEEDYEMEGSASLFIPRAGVRFALGGESLRPYLFADLFKSFASVKVEKENSWREYQNGELVESGSDDDDLSGDDEDFIKKLLGVWGLNLGFGTEYMFNESFGVAGEYALRLYRTSADRSESEWSGGGQQEWREEWEEELSGTLRMTYAAVALTYHFQ